MQLSKRAKLLPLILGLRPGFLWLTTDNNQQDKLFFYFSHLRHKERQKEPIKFERSLEEEVIKIESKSKKVITKLASWQIKKLRDKGFSWQEIREFCNVSE